MKPGVATLLGVLLVASVLGLLLVMRSEKDTNDTNNEANLPDDVDSKEQGTSSSQQTQSGNQDASQDASQDTLPESQSGGESGEVEDENIVEEEILSAGNTDIMQACQGSWNTDNCAVNGKKVWKNTSTNGCTIEREDGTEADCEICSGSFGKCAPLEGENYAVSRYTITNHGDYCPPEILETEGISRTCEKCKADLGDCDPLTGVKTYTGFAENDYEDYPEDATTEYWCPSEERDLVGTTVTGQCTICELGQSACMVDNNTGQFFETTEITNQGSYDYCPQNMQNIADSGTPCAIPNAMLSQFNLTLDFESKMQIKYRLINGSRGFSKKPSRAFLGGMFDAFNDIVDPVMPTAIEIVFEKDWSEYTQKINQSLGTLTFNLNQNYEATMTWVGDGNEVSTTRKVSFELEEEGFYRIVWEEPLPEIDNPLEFMTQSVENSGLLGYLESVSSEGENVGEQDDPFIQKVFPTDPHKYKDFDYSPKSYNPNNLFNPYIIWKDNTWHICLGDTLRPMSNNNSENLENLENVNKANNSPPSVWY